MKKFLPNWKWLYGRTERYLSDMLQEGYRYKKRKGAYIYLEPCEPYKAEFFAYFLTDPRPTVQGCEDIAIKVNILYGRKKKKRERGFVNFDPLVIELEPEKIDENFVQYVNERNKRCIYSALHKLLLSSLGLLIPALLLILDRKISFLFFVFLFLMIVCGVNVGLNVRQYIKYKRNVKGRKTSTRTPQ